MPYRIEYDGCLSSIEPTDPDDPDAYDTFSAAKKDLLEWLRTVRNDYNRSIAELKKLTRAEIDT